MKEAWIDEMNEGKGRTIAAMKVSEIYFLFYLLFCLLPYKRTVDISLLTVSFSLSLRNIYWTEMKGIYVTNEDVYMMTKTLQYSDSNTFSPLSIVVNPSNGSGIFSFVHSFVLC